MPDGEQEALLAIAHRGRQTGWWLDYATCCRRPAQDYVIMEIAATEILAYEPNQVPDLLQTPDYASALADADARYAAGDDQRAHAIEVKLSQAADRGRPRRAPAGGRDHRGGAAPDGRAAAGDAGAARPAGRRGRAGG